MTYLYGSTLVVLTLLQLCRAEISDSMPDPWYSANVINDGFQPKPISEIFSTESTFSSTNPIIVLPKASSSPQEGTSLLTTLSPSTLKVSSAGTTGDLTETLSIISSTPSTPLYSTEETPQRNPISVQVQTEIKSPILELIQSVQPIQPLLPSASPEQPIQQIQTTDPLLPGVQSIQTTSPQAPQNIQNYPPQQQVAPFVSNQNPSSTIPTTTLSPTTQPLPQVAVQTVSSKVPETLTSTNAFETLSTAKLVASTARTIVTTSNYRATQGVNRKLGTPTAIVQRPPLFPWTIRVVAPVGSITNVKINPTSTTRRPTTTRTRKSKPKRNRYDVCIDSCKGKKEPICGVPISGGHIDPRTLKGFPSVCHMACHNSFRKDTYEKLIDGRCGKLRSRIRIVESNKRLKRPELKKAEYIVENVGPKTIVEFTGLV
ncbi:mucin-2 isoform X2 [Bombyx mori]|uniref:Kazal-like domain-containing protein n=1 Tax=Bombyx mori TaxID=7091 RepID=A0A8R2R3Y6_BOMMO|nr:transcription initiation factor TFIID subunit 12 [Bombyx mori]